MIIPVYCYFLEKADISELVRSGAFARLGKEALQRAEGLSSKRKREYLLSRALLKFALSLHLPNKSLWNIAVQEQDGGPPFVGLAEDHGVFFNISHSHDLIGVAVSLEGVVGLDTEYLSKRRCYQLGAQSFCTTFEYDRVVNAPSEEQRARLYYRYWTRKEAYLKYTREGIGKTPMREITFVSDDEGEHKQPQVVGGSIGQYQIAVVSKSVNALAFFDVEVGSDGELGHRSMHEDLLDDYRGVLGLA